MNNKGADQTAWMRRLICTFVVRIWHKQVFSWCGWNGIENNWAATSEFGTYRLCEQRRFRRACASAQSRQNLRCSLIQAVSQEEPSDRKPEPWPLWMAGHAQLKFVMTECSKTQIRLTGLNWFKNLISSLNLPSRKEYISSPIFLRFKSCRYICLKWFKFATSRLWRYWQNLHICQQSVWADICENGIGEWWWLQVWAFVQSH